MGIKEEKDREMVKVMMIGEDNKEEEEDEEQIDELDDEGQSKIEQVVIAKNVETETGDVVSGFEENRSGTKSTGIEVVKSEEEFNRRKADNSAPVVIFEDVDEDWQQEEEGISFGFDVNQDLVLHAGSE